MRDYGLILVILVLIPLIFKRPQNGIFAWSWISYMNPHRMTWGIAYSLPLAQVIALVTLVSVVIWKGPKRIPVTGITITWGLFLVWMTFTTFFAFFPEYAFDKLILVYKIQLVTFLTILLIRTKKDIDILIWVITMSVGFFTIKGGAFTILTLGSHRVWGPTGSFIADNNALAIAGFMIIPMMYYLYGQATHKLVKYGLIIAMFLTFVSAFGSQSRGALIASGATGLYFWWKAPHKFLNAFIVVFLFIGILSFMPETWWTRMYTILEYEEDGSAMGRLAAWELAMNIASHRITGGGFDCWGQEMFRMFSDNPDHWNKNVAAHSIYFTIVGEHGWPGAVLFVLIYLMGWRTASRVAAQAKQIESLKWVHSLMSLLQVSLISYASGGAFLNLSYFDLPWHILSIIVIARMVLEEHMAGENEMSVDQSPRRISRRHGLAARKPLPIDQRLAGS